MDTYDVLLTGATGQIGRHVLTALLKQGKTVSVVMRRKDKWQAVEELTRITNLPLTLTGGVGVYLGDLTDAKCPLPTVDRIINCAGHTALGMKPVANYWQDNIQVAIRLAHYAKRTGAFLHQLSSVAVAEFRGHVLTEEDTPIPDERQLTYSMSKVMVELAVTSIVPRCQILRLGDAIPPPFRIREDFRENHWLPILFRYGREGFAYAPDDYSVWLATGDQIGRAISLLTETRLQRCHILGQMYPWKFFRQHALEGGRKPITYIIKWMSDIILHGPEAHEVSDSITAREFKNLGFQWLSPGAEYWKQFAQRSLEQSSNTVLV